MKIVAKAALIVGSVAAIATGVGAIAGISTIAGLSMGTIQAIAIAANVTAGIAGQFTPHKSNITGNSTQFKADPEAGIPYMMGRTIHSGNIIHRASWGTDNQYQGFVVVWSGGGPVDGIEEFLVDYSPVTFDVATKAALGTRFGVDGDHGPWMWLSTQLGEAPEASALVSPVAGLPDWGLDYKTSGYFSGIWVIKFDKKGKKYAGGVPAPGMVARSVLVYDPRLDDTYPGGSGPCRALDESTYVFSENGPLHALTFAIGRWQGPPGDTPQRVVGVGMDVTQIEMDAFVDAANSYDDNGWKMGGVVYSTDDKWAVLKNILLTGAGEPMQLGAKLSCYISAPKVSVATITSDDLVGDVQIVNSNPRRDRVNTIISRFRSETHSWQMVPASAVSFPDLVTQDRGRRRTEELQIELCQDIDQSVQVAAYRILNARERGPITIPVKPYLMGLRPGDCVTLDLPQLALDSQKAIIRRRKLQPETGHVQFVLVTEDDDKHTRALSQVGTIGPPIDFTPDEPTDGSLSDPVIIQLYIANSYPVFTTSGSVASDVGTDVTLHIDAHDRVYSDFSAPVDDGDITGLPFGTVIYIYYDDPDRLGGAVLYQSTLVKADALNSDTHTGRHYMGQVTTPADGSTPTNFEPYSP